MNHYPWNNTTNNIAAENDSRYETPGGAQAKVDGAIEDLVVTAAKISNWTITEAKYGTGSVSNRALADFSVDSSKMDPSLFDNITDIAINSRFGQLDQQFSNTYQYVYKYKTGSNTWADALESCISFCMLNYLKKIRLPSGDLEINRDIIVNGSTESWDLIIEGEGIGIDGRGTCLKFVSNAKFDVNLSATAGTWRGITFRDLTLRGDNANTGIKFAFCQQASFENVEFRDLNKGCVLTGDSHYSNFVNCKWINCNNGLYVPEVGNGDYAVGGVNHTKISNGFFTYCNTPIFQSGQGSGWLIENTDFEGHNGKIELGSGNRLINVRIERNNNDTTWIDIGSENNVDILMAAAGGNIASVFMNVKGDSNEIILRGTNLVAFSDFTGRYNNITLVGLGTLLDCAVISFVDKTNTFYVRGNRSENIVNQDLNTWSKTTNLTINAGTIPNGKSSYQLVKTGGTDEYVSYTVPGSFLTGQNVFFTLDMKVDAGAGFYANIDGYNAVITDYFPSYSTNKKTILSHVMTSDKSSIEIRIGITGGNGSAIQVGNVVAAKAMNNLLFD